MLYQQPPEKIAQKLLAQIKQIPNILKQNDSMVLAWNKSQLFRRWPRCMVPGTQKIEGNNILFTGMLQNTKEKAYEYGQFLSPLNYQFKEKVFNIIEQEVNPEPEKVEFTVQIEVGQNQQAPQNLQASQKSSKLPLENSIKAESVKFRQQLSPFLANYDNPFDRNANTKALKQKFEKIKIDQRKRNIAALIEQSKKSNESRQQFKYGRSAPKKPTDSIDITDILKYTLGIKKQKQQGLKPEPLQNPFVKVPAKYYDSMGDFYKSPK